MAGLGRETEEVEGCEEGRNLITASERRRVREEEEWERRRRCIHLDGLSERELSAHSDALNWRDPRCGGRGGQWNDRRVRREGRGDEDGEEGEGEDGGPTVRERKVALL